MITLTYFANSDSDGIGAQLQRQAAIYSMSKILNFSFVYTPLNSFGFNPGDGVNGDESIKNQVLGEINLQFILPSSLNIDFYDEIILKDLSLTNFRKLLKCHLSKKNYLVRIYNPFPFFDIFNFNYKPAQKVWAKPLISGEIRQNYLIDVHIRRAVSPVASKIEKKYHRHLETRWYLNLITQLDRIFQSLDKQVTFRVHTDGTKSGEKIDTNIVGLDSSTRVLWEEHGFIDSDGFLHQNVENLVSAFSNIRNIDFFQELKPNVALKMMIESDLLIGCKSSFSFVAGLSKYNQPVIFPKFWHRMPKDWLQPTGQGLLSLSQENRIIKILREL